MPWETFQSKDGIYQVNWEGVSRLIRSAARSQAMLTFSKENIERHRVGPNIHSVEVDWGKVQDTTIVESDRLLKSFYFGAQESMGTQLSQLRRLLEPHQLFD